MYIEDLGVKKLDKRPTFDLKSPDIFLVYLAVFLVALEIGTFAMLLIIKL